MRRPVNSKERLSKAIPVMFKPDEDGKIFPDGYKNDVAWWGNISKEKLHSCLPDGTAKMFCMDVDYGDVCGLGCEHCYRRDRRFDTAENPLTHEEIVGYIKEAHETLGLEHIKVAGRGEPFREKRFLEFIEDVVGMGVGLSIFTKGDVLGSGELTKRYNKHRGITTSRQLIQRLKELDVSILLGFNSFDRKMQEAFVGVDKYPKRSLMRRKFVDFRDQALIDLVKAGFNEYVEGQATRLAMIAAPMKPENISELLDMFTFARERNIYLVACPTNVSGKGIDEANRVRALPDMQRSAYMSQLIYAWYEVYVWAIQTNLIPLSVFMEYGVGLYPGCHYCNQIAAGFFLNLSGQVNQCPGRCDKNTIYSYDIRKDGLIPTWKGSLVYKRAKYGKKFNYRCPARDHTVDNMLEKFSFSLPPAFYRQVKAKVLEALGA